MGHAYQAVGWNRQKKLYDRTLLGGVLLYLLAFVGVTAATQPHVTFETTLIRAAGTAAFVLLHVILSIGPLARLDHRFLPLLYNRRHMGVTMFALALVHGAFSIFQFHTLGTVNPFVSLFTSNPHYGSLADFPFQPLGALALVILFLMAATSHDFWLANLGAPAWKALHMLVYLAYALLVMHVALGALQSERSPVLLAAVAVGLAAVTTLHLVAGWREAPADREEDAAADGFVDVCAVDDLEDGHGRTVCVAGDRVAVFRYDGKVSALSNACQHQNGPLGEGRVIDGCVHCPWHGYQYNPDDGASPAPFTERVPTFDVRVEGGRVLVNPRPNPAGTRVQPPRIEAGGA
jgi:nitrite reductase/ring-hydroxylating ferredoxin subunit/DMSO/TMAO reductase YedYZ heme-binding membrane subunit